MDPEALLEYALFQLTPTRTRCDLVVFSGGKSEKLASGLVEPFVCHLKFAKDQIPKGGYSITLRPPTTDASWFTKATFQRFVRFVNTPEVLERFARLEKEIFQIESSVQSNEFDNGNVAGKTDEGNLFTAEGNTKQSTNSSKLKGENGEIEGTVDAVHEENSKICLQRLLETRKALLRKEQAMAYARALAAGFELDNIDELIFFADVFGASRLREACTDFKELCKKKHTDDLWMNELAAMEAYPPPDLSLLGTSGIILAGESATSYHNSMLNFQPNGGSTGKLVSNGSLDASSDSTASQANSDSNKDSNMPASDQVPSNSAKVPQQMPWPNQIPQYMFNFPGAAQQMHPYQAYPFPGMQPLPSYYPGNMHWPRNMDEPNHRRQSSSLRKKEKSSNVQGPETSEEDEQTESSDSNTGTDSEETAFHERKNSSKEQTYKKKNGKKSSKTVVIRNINYITSMKRNEEKDGVSYDSSSVEDEFIDEDSIKQKVEDVVGSLEKHHKATSKNNKKRDGNKRPSFVNGSNGYTDLELENDVITNTSEVGKGNENWGAFQNLLMREEESTTTVLENPKPLDVLDEHFNIKSTIDSATSTNVDSVDFDSEKIQMRKTFGMDSFVLTERNEVNEGRVNSDDFGNSETFRPNMKRRDCAEEALLFPQRSDESRSMLVSDCGTESSIIKKGNGEDWFIVNHSGRSESREAVINGAIFDGGNVLSSESDRPNVEISKKIVPVDDSFMVQGHTSVDDQYDSHWKTDITMVSGLIVADQPENGNPNYSQNKAGVSSAYEPDDLCVVLTRNSGFETSGVSWSPEVDYEVETSFTEADKKSSVIQTNDQIEEKSPTNIKSTNAKSSTTTNSVKQSRSKGLSGSVAKSKFDVLSQSKKSFPSSKPMTQKSKLDKEEEARKRTEELLIQRQKRIAERTAASGITPLASKKVPVGSRPQLNSPKLGGSGVSKSDQLKKTSAKVIGVVNAY